ncbi:MAG TPA: hypothetical protein VIF43_02505 [Patescibacteria group bacterium]|jgi:hypothetical protein
MNTPDNDTDRQAAEEQAAAYGDAVAYHEEAPVGDEDNANVEMPKQAAPHRLLRPRNLIVAAVALVLAGAAVAAWFLILRPTPEKILGEMFQRMESVKAFEYDLDVKGEYRQDGKASVSEALIGQAQAAGKSGNFDLSLQGIYDYRDASEPQVSLRAEGSASDGGKTYDGALELRYVGKTAYLQLANSPDEFKQYTKPFLGQWLMFGENEVNQGKELTTQEGPTIDDKDAQEIARMLLDTGAVRLTYDGGDTIDGDAVDIVGYEIDKDGLKEAMPKIYRIVEDEDMPKEERKSFDDNLEMVEFEPGRIAVDKKTKLLRELTVKFGGTENDVSTTVSTTLKLKNFDDQVGKVEVPKGALTFEEMAARLSNDDDRDDLPYMQELLFGADPGKRDTDGDSFPDGAEVKGGYDPAGPGRLQNSWLGSSGLFGV